MSSNVQLYSKGVVVDDTAGDPVFSTLDEVSVYLKDVNAIDLVSEFMPSEILDAMDYADVKAWLIMQESDNE